MVPRGFAVGREVALASNMRFLGFSVLASLATACGGDIAEPAVEGVSNGNVGGGSGDPVDAGTDPQSSDPADGAPEFGDFVLARYCSESGTGLSNGLKIVISNFIQGGMCTSIDGGETLAFYFPTTASLYSGQVLQLSPEGYANSAWRCPGKEGTDCTRLPGGEVVIDRYVAGVGVDGYFNLPGGLKELFSASFCDDGTDACP